MQRKWKEITERSGKEAGLQRREARSEMCRGPLGTPDPISHCSSGLSLPFFLGFCKTLQYLLGNPDGVLWLTKGKLLSPCVAVAAPGGARRLSRCKDHTSPWATQTKISLEKNTAVLEGNSTVLTTWNLTIRITVLLINSCRILGHLL